MLNMNFSILDQEKNRSRCVEREVRLSSRTLSGREFEQC